MFVIPAHLQHAAEIDERVSQALSNVVIGLAPQDGRDASGVRHGA